MAFSSFWPAVFFILSFVVVVAAQDHRGGFTGNVVNTMGAPVEGTIVTVTRLGTQETISATTDRYGIYSIPKLTPGNYRLSAERNGFTRQDLPEFRLEIDQMARVDFRLEVGEISETVTIEAYGETLNTETASLGTVVSSREVEDIPLNGRNYLSLALLSPGVVPAAAGANPHNINGARSDHVNYLIDGTPNVNRRGNEPVVTPSLDAIQEFKILTNGYSAEYGRLGAGVISVALKTATNRYHGTAFIFNRNDALDARGFFDTEKLKLDRTHFGGVLNGPIRKDNTYLLLSYEGVRSLRGETPVTRVPTAAERQGIFASPIRNPFTGQAFANNTIPAGLMSPIAQRLIALFPEPNRSGVLNFSTAADVEEDQNYLLGKIDHRITAKDQLSGRFFYNRLTLANPFRSTAIPGFGASRTGNKQMLSIGYTRVFSGSVVNDARFGFTRDKFDEVSENAGSNTSSDLGITGVAPGFGLANIVVVGFPEIGDATFLPDRWTDREFSFINTFSVAFGRHFMKAGVEIQHSRVSNLFASFAGGQIAFNGAFTLNPLADLLLGLPVQTQRQVGTNLSNLSSTYYGFFIQDDWRISRRLTLNLGLRYDLNKPPTEADGRWANFVPSEGRLIAAGTPGFPEAVLRTDRNNFSPRVGLAYRPFGDGRTVIRAGYGIFHSFDLLFTQYQIMGASAFPFTRLELFQATAVGNPSLAEPFPNRPGLTPGALSPNGWDIENPTPYMQSWNITVGHAFRNGVSVETSYVGSKGTHLSSTVNLNQTIRTPQGSISPFPGFGRILYQGLGANSSYNSLQVSVQQRLTGGLAFRSAFTWSRSIDSASFGSPARLPQNPQDLSAERGLSEFDRRRVWNSDVIYEVPFGRGRRFGGGISSLVDVILGGWQINGLVQMYDGRPFTPVASRANTQAGFAARPDRIASGEVARPTADQWFDPSAFVVVPANEFRFGTSGRNILIGPGAVIIDASLFKHFEMPWEGHRLQFKAEVFNLPNRANFGQPDARIDQPTAGTISSAGPGRQVQLAIKYLF